MEAEGGRLRDPLMPGIPTQAMCVNRADPRRPCPVDAGSRPVLGVFEPLMDPVMLWRRSPWPPIADLFTQEAMERMPGDRHPLPTRPRPSASSAPYCWTRTTTGPSRNATTSRRNPWPRSAPDPRRSPPRQLSRCEPRNLCWRNQGHASTTPRGHGRWKNGPCGLSSQHQRSGAFGSIGARSEVTFSAPATMRSFGVKSGST